MPTNSGGAERLFLAVPLTPGARAELQAHLAGLPTLPGRRVPAENWHLTLRFLGETGRELAAHVAEEVERGPLGPAFDIRLGGLGAFPRPARARVLWIGIAEGEAPLRELAARVAEAVERAGIEPEPRPFAAHLTLARLRDPQDVRPLLAHAPAAGIELPVREVVLYRSHLGGPAPRYEAVRRFPLALA